MFYMIGTLGKNGWPLPNAYWICQGTAFLVYATTGTSIYTIAAIALNRLVIITKPHMYRKLFKSWKLMIYIAIPWIVPSFGIMICAFLEMGDFGYDPGDLTCSAIDTPCDTLALSLFITLIGFPIPLAVIMVSYICIYIHLKKHFKKQKRRYADSETVNKSQEPITAVSPSVETEFIEPHNSADRLSGKCVSHNQVLAARQKKRILQQQIKITKNLFTVVCGFLLCFLPYLILTIIDNSEHFLFYTKVITCANCAINFPIYGLRHPDFNVVLRCMIQRSFAKIPQPSKFLNFFLSKNV